MEKQTLLQVEQLSKKFSKDIWSNMYYGLQDILWQRAQKENLRRNEFWALQDINLRLHSGDILGVVGVNGSGKTTLMRQIAGIYPVNFGAISSAPALKITAVFALKAGMQPLFTGRENIRLKGAMYGMSQSEIEDQMDFIESFSELGDKLDRPFGNYSSGMKARLGYSIALATQPDVLIIDEALAVGDTAFREKCFDNIKSFVRQPQKAVIFVSNHIHKIMRVANRLVVLDQGAIRYESEDVKAGLEFYIHNSGNKLRPELRAANLKAIREGNLG